MGLSRKKSNSFLYPPPDLQYPLSSDILLLSSQPGQHDIDKPCQTTEDMLGGNSREPLGVEMLKPQRVNESNKHGGNEIQGGESSYGFAINSGWSSTFLPCEMDGEPEDQSIHS